MGHAITELVEGAMGSPWLYVALLAFAAIDGFFPVVPSESLVVSAGVFAATGEPNVFAVIGVAALGAFAGDHISYLLGRTAGRRLNPGGRKAAAVERGGRLLAERGGTILIVCRYIPGARTAVTLTAGAVRYPLHRFSLFDGAAALSWGRVFGAGRLRRRRRVRGRSAEGPRARPRHRPDRHAAGRAGPARTPASGRSRAGLS